jgi:hypothetical protein
MWRKQVEQWRKYVIWENRGFPVDLILSIIDHESGGHAGRRAAVACKPGELAKVDGSKVTLNHAYGLMQVIPSTVAWYNQIHPSEPAYVEDIKGTGERASRLQIRIGVWLLAHNLRQLFNLDPVSFPGQNASSATPDQIMSALVAYAIGLGALKQRLEILKSEGRALTLNSLGERFPLWGYSQAQDRWINRPVQYAGVVWRNFERNKGTGTEISEPDKPISEVVKKKVTEYSVPILILLGLWLAKRFFHGSAE